MEVKWRSNGGQTSFPWTKNNKDKWGVVFGVFQGARLKSGLKNNVHHTGGHLGRKNGGQCVKSGIRLLLLYSICAVLFILYFPPPPARVVLRTGFVDKQTCLRTEEWSVQSSVFSSVPHDKELSRDPEPTASVPEPLVDYTFRRPPCWTSTLQKSASSSWRDSGPSSQTRESHLSTLYIKICTIPSLYFVLRFTNYVFLV